MTSPPISFQQCTLISVLWIRKDSNLHTLNANHVDKDNTVKLSSLCIRKYILSAPLSCHRFKPVLDVRVCMPFSIIQNYTPTPWDTNTDARSSMQYTLHTSNICFSTSMQLVANLIIILKYHTLQIWWQWKNNCWHHQHQQTNTLNTEHY